MAYGCWMHMVYFLCKVAVLLPPGKSAAGCLPNFFVLVVAGAGGVPASHLLALEG